MWLRGMPQSCHGVHAVSSQMQGNTNVQPPHFTALQVRTAFYDGASETAFSQLPLAAQGVAT